MMIAFRHTPFSEKQKSELSAISKEGGYIPRWYEDTEEVLLADLINAKALMGYFPVELLKHLPNLKWLQTPAAGVDRLCGDIYASPSIILTNCSGAFGSAIAEYMLTGLMMLFRNMPAYMKNQRAHIWCEDKCCRSIENSILTVVGMGDIGCAFAKRAKAMGAYIKGVRRTASKPDEFFDEVYASHEIQTAVQGADAVILCLPGTQETRHLLSCEIIDSLDKKTVIVNAGRGITIDQAALTDALVAGRIAGAVLDVFSPEPLCAESPLWDLENVIITPHISGHDIDPINASKIFEIFKENLTRFIHNEPLINVVDRKIGY